MISIAPKIIEKPVRSISDEGNARLGVLEQVERSWKPGNRLATLMGAMLGGLSDWRAIRLRTKKPRTSQSFGCWWLAASRTQR